MQIIIILYLFCHCFHHLDCIQQIIYVHIIPLERLYKRFCHAVTSRTAYWCSTHDEPQ
nr:MAG TPA: hypothetical protein [Caudoviricetes sp.]